MLIMTGDTDHALVNNADNDRRYRPCTSKSNSELHIETR
jgi:hypothetical protein